MKAARYVFTIIIASLYATIGTFGDLLQPAENGSSVEEFMPAPIIAVPGLDEDLPPARSRSVISISLDDVELIDVVRMFSRIASANIVANPEILTARVTVNLDDVEWRPALSSILSMHSLALVERPQGSGVYAVIDQPPDAPIPMTVETVFLKYTTVDEVRPVVERMLGGGSLSVFPSRNAMVIRATESNLNDIKIVLEEIDILGKQVVVETQFMELSDRALKQLGIRWDSLAEMGVNFQAGPFVTQRQSDRTRSREDSLVRSDSLQRTDQSDLYYDMFGTQGQVIDPATQLAEPTRTITSLEDQSRVASSQILDSTTRAVATGSAAILNVDSLNIVLSALKSTDGVNIVSNPKIIVSSGSTNAFFSVGEREPIIRRTVLRGTAESPGDQVLAELDTSINTEYIRSGYLNTGIELLVVPTVKTDDLIEARIEPSLRRKIGEKSVDGNVWPVIAVKEIRTHFTLQSGQTVAIGGLTDSTDSKQTSKVPLLGDIPIIGKYLFSHERDETRQTETIIFVTLGLADPMAIERHEGIPERSELVYKREIRDRMRRLEIQAEIEELQQAARRLENQFERRQRNSQTAEETVIEETVIEETAEETATAETPAEETASAPLDAETATEETMAEAPAETNASEAPANAEAAAEEAALEP